LQVVCGAPNVEEGALYPFAPVGATLPGGLQLRKAKIRGEYSQGMLCSEKELGLGRDASGIMRLADSHRVGAPLVEALGLDDTRLTIEVTANRPDLLSHVGVAREVAPDGHHGIELAPFPGPDGVAPTDRSMPEMDVRRTAREGRAGPATVRIEDADGCPRYMAAVIEGVEVDASPSWLAARLRSIGQRPINNVVDATN
jgi:phenylalanyl-tRNA synthetase beta chain